MRVWKRIKVGWDPWWSITTTLHMLKELDENPRGRKGCRRLLGNDTNFVALRCGCPKCQVIHLFYVIPLSMLCFNPANYSLFLLSGFHSFVSGGHKEQPKDVSEIFPPIPLESHQITEESSCLLFLFPLICDARTRPAYTEWRRLHQYYKVVDPLCKPTNLFWFVLFFFFSFFLFVSCAIRPLFCYLLPIHNHMHTWNGKKKRWRNREQWKSVTMNDDETFVVVFSRLARCMDLKSSDDDDNGRRKGVVVVPLFR